MAIFKYKGVDSDGKDISSTITADNITLAKGRVSAQGIMLISIEEQKSHATAKRTGIGLRSGVNIDELSLMTRQLATLIKAKIQIVEALSSADRSNRKQHP